jgi:hypothetical protein|tara:strand:- start:748 stop:2400 length:1653 start_codon:yes stop_codon:yes gene_type:complete
MKKILSILVSVLFTLSSFGQGSLNLEHQSGTIQKVGDEFVMKIQYYTGDQGDATLLQFDYEYNNKLLELTEFNWASGVPSDYSKTRNQWTGYKYNNRPDTEATDMDLQYQWWQSEAGNNSYSANQDFNVNRITVQGTTAWTNGNVIVTIKFKVKDNFGTNYSDYSNVIALNWANIKKADGSQLQVTRNGDYSLGSIQGGNAGDVTLNLKTANTAGYADYGYTIKYDGESVKTGDFDAGGQAVVSGLENDKIYSIEVNLSELPEYLDEVVTVADLAKVFAEAIGAGSGPSGTTSTWDYHVQAVIGDVVGDDNKVDFQDSYEIMAYLQSITTGNTNRITQANATYDKWGIEGTYGDNTQSSMFLNTFTLTDTNQSSKTINVAHGLVGDVNFTHSYEPSAEGAAKSTQASARNSMGVQYSSVQGADPLYKSEEANLDLVSEIKDDGTVEFTIEMDVENLIGTQFNVKYNTTVLTLDNVIFDTGNEMTNFSNIDGDKIRIGSFDQNFTATVKTGTPYKLIFTPNEAIQNTSGLITFKVTEGVKDDGTQVNFIIN